jgi:hypothetical protein
MACFPLHLPRFYEESHVLKPAYFRTVRISQVTLSSWGKMLASKRKVRKVKKKQVLVAESWHFVSAHHQHYLRNFFSLWFVCFFVSTEI